ncbi:unnamed protein product [Larinioides sclopetarius]|uniref:Uncharacterized protein n=1 Tax=Larinioides sclopetarius TaxID=280406 RepID=A0AAV1Z0U5_9ARAC
MPVLNLDMVDLASSNPALVQKKARICVGLGMAQARDFEIDIPPSDVVERQSILPSLLSAAVPLLQRNGNYFENGPTKLVEPDCRRLAESKLKNA